MQALTRLNQVLNRIVNLLCWVIMSCLIIIVSFQVINRFAIRVPAAWTEEFSRYIFVWLTLLGTVKGIKEGAHLNVDMLVSSLQRRNRALVSLSAGVIALLFFVCLGVTGWTYAVDNLAVLNDTGSVPMFVVYVAIPASCGLAIPILLEDVIRIAKEVRRS